MDRSIFERKKVLMKYGRQINSALVWYHLNQIKKICKKNKIHHLLFKEHLICTLEHYTHQLELNQILCKMYLYDPTNVGDESKIDIRMNHVWLPSSMSATEKKIIERGGDTI